MLEVLCNNPTIYQFLDNYPKDIWRRCIEAAAVCGIVTLQSKYGPHPNHEVLNSYLYQEKSSKDNLIRQKIQLMKADLDQLNQAFGKIDKTSELEQASTPKFNLTHDSNFKRDDLSFEHTNFLINSPPKSTKSQEIQDLKRPPRYIQNNESKLKPALKREIQQNSDQISFSNRPSLGLNPSPKKSSKSVSKESSFKIEYTESDRYIPPSPIRTLQTSKKLTSEPTSILKQAEHQTRNRRPQSKMLKIIEPKLCPLSTAESLFKHVSPSNRASVINIKI